MIEKVLAWAKSDPNIIGVILTGSRVKPAKADAYSDYDLILICKDSKPLERNQDWLHKLGKLWVCIPEQRAVEKKQINTRLAIFEPGIKCDFSLVPQHALEYLTPLFDDGYKILLDKDKLKSCLLKPTYSSCLVKRPSEKEFRDLIEEFWFEAYHIGNYLMRGDLWAVKFRDADIKHRLLLRLLLWHQAAKKKWKLRALPTGQGMQAWADPKIWKWAHRLFPSFARETSWRSLVHTIVFFRECAEELALDLGYHYSAELDRHFTGYLLHLMNQKKSFQRKKKSSQTRSV